MRDQRATGKIQRNNYRHGNCGPSLTGHWTDRNVKNRWVKSSLYTETMKTQTFEYAQSKVDWFENATKWKRNDLKTYPCNRGLRSSLEFDISDIFYTFKLLTPLLTLNRPGFSESGKASGRIPPPPPSPCNFSVWSLSYFYRLSLIPYPEKIPLYNWIIFIIQTSLTLETGILKGGLSTLNYCHS